MAHREILKSWLSLEKGNLIVFNMGLEMRYLGITHAQKRPRKNSYTELLREPSSTFWMVGGIC